MHMYMKKNASKEQGLLLVDTLHAIFEIYNFQGVEIHQVTFWAMQRAHVVVLIHIQCTKSPIVPVAKN